MEKLNAYFFKKQNLRKITEKQKQIMNGSIAIRKVCEAIKKTKTEKVLGSDGLPAFYYKYFEDELLQPLQTWWIILCGGERF